MAVEHGTASTAMAGPLLVIAGAGTGKTATLVHRLAWLIANGVATERVLLLTFSRRAAAEMEHRAGALLVDVIAGHAPAATLSSGGAARFSLPWAGTFHSIAAQLLRRHGHLLGLNRSFTVIDRSDAIDCIDWLRGEMALDRSTSRFPRAGTCLAIYSDRINTGEDLAPLLQQRHPWCVQWLEAINRLLRAYVEHKQSQALLDYDDLLLWWRLGMDEPAFAQAVRAHFDHVLVDEYQDSNRLQVELLTALRPDGEGLFVVGDDAQSIYAFRGADVDHIYRFCGQFSPPARRIALTVNYRSTQRVLDTANALIAGAGGPFDKTLRADDPLPGARPRLVTVLDDMAQADWVVQRVLQRRETGVALREQAILFRTASHSDLLEIALTRHNLPFVKYGGLRFVEAAHIKDAMAMLRWSVNPRDLLAGFRVLQLLEGVGPASARAILAPFHHPACGESAARMRFEQLECAPPAGLPREHWSALAQAMQALSDSEGTVGDKMRALSGWLAPVISNRYPDPEPRVADLDMLAGLAAGYADVPALIASLALDPPNATGGWGEDAAVDEDYLILSTVHSAKGQEWHSVTVLNVADGSFPNEFAAGNPAAIDEERRLLYVAMTRARRDLELIEPQRYYLTRQRRHGAAHVYGARSRFLDARVVASMDQVAAAGGSPMVRPDQADSSGTRGVSDRQEIPDASGRRAAATSAVSDRIKLFWPSHGEA